MLTSQDNIKTCQRLLQTGLIKHPRRNRKYWGGGDKGRVNNLLLHFGSISPAKHEPEEMGSLLCAFAVVCC